jgi:hypothetical protein
VGASQGCVHNDQEESFARIDWLLDSRATLNSPAQSAVLLPKRLLFIDVARSLAIFLALVAHAMSALQGYTLFGPSTKLWSKLLTRTATPMFVVMFGMMLELVYHRRWNTDGPIATSRRLMVRGLQCYLGYLATVFAGYLVGTRDLATSLKAAAFLATPSFGFTLRFYCFALLLAIPMLACRVRWGRGSLAILLGVIWATYPAVRSLQTASIDLLPVPFGMLFGTVTRPVGPSVLQGLTFVLAGMLCAGALEGWKEVGLKRFRSHLGVMMFLALLPLLYIAAQTSLLHVLEQFTGILWRRQNHIGYYSFGLVNCGLVLLGLSILFPANRHAPPHANLSLAFGRSSLLAFTSGNVIVVLAAPLVSPSSVPALVATISALLVAVWLIVIAREMWSNRRAEPPSG